MVWAAAKTSKIRQNSDKKLDRKLHRFFYDFLMDFGIDFGVILDVFCDEKSNICFDRVLDVLFLRLASATPLRRDFSARAYGPDAP